MTNPRIETQDGETVMQQSVTMHPALFITKVGALTAVVRACTKLGVDVGTVAKKGKAKPVYKRGELLGYRAVYPRPDGGFDVVKETYNGQKCYHLN